MTGDGSVAIAVADQGIGISGELRPRLFDTYAQGHVSTERRTSGMGLGLAIVKGLVDLHGGAIEVQSGGTGLGSTFIVSLPAAVGGQTPSEN